ncbi:pectate lyase [Sphingomonas sp. JC676]|uniref:pectate lyase n=1 Tax=Sphingomonas sp. JC676 TaxID=2768065 RepID=UPI0016579A2A|nr:pectate lyase [Sphingomonas sp. JC676]MBC9031029.1 pectate lyase [Sphingomonas sp. JC676]
MTKVRGILAAGLLLGGAWPAHAGDRTPVPVTAFPGAEGAGAVARGGRGGAVLFVTNLEDSGPGSLRAAVETKGPRTILFRISGTIRLLKPLVVREGRVTIAGQSAPGDGITLRDQRLQVSADDVVIRYIRSRLGDESKTESDAIWVSKGRRIILDHVSASWSVDETLSASANYTSPDEGYYDLTVQWSIISESLTHSLHAKGEHGYGSLIRAGRGAKVSFHHNLWANHEARMPRPGNYSGPEVDPLGAFFDFRSNVFYNWGKGHSGYNADKATLSRYNFVDNAYVAGPQSEKAIAFDESDMLAKAWFAGNSMNGAIPTDPWSLVTGVQPEGYRLAAPVDVARVKPEAAASAYASVLAQAGASKARDPVDARVIAGVRDRTGRQIDSQRDVGGWPELKSLPTPRDSDQDGMPDAWEKAHGLNPNDVGDGGKDRNGDGWTNLEEWLADLVK